MIFQFFEAKKCEYFEAIQIEQEKLNRLIFECCEKIVPALISSACSFHQVFYASQIFWATQSILLNKEVSSFHVKILYGKNLRTFV